MQAIGAPAQEEPLPFPHGHDIGMQRGQSCRASIHLLNDNAETAEGFLFKVDAAQLEGEQKQQYTMLRGQLLYQMKKFNTTTI